MMDERTKFLVKTNFFASMISFGATATISLFTTTKAADLNIGLALGSITGLTAIMFTSLEILEEVQE